MHEAGRFDEQEIIILSSAEEWRRFVLPHLLKWGLRVHSHDHPSLIDEEKISAACALIILGENNIWAPSEENRLVEEVSCVVECHPDGPPQPVRRGRYISVTCYSLKGLENALLQILKPLDARGQKLSTLSVNFRPDAELPSRERRLRVVVAEDNPLNRQLLSEQLLILDCDARIVSNGTEALEALSVATADALLTDIRMEGMSGYELAVEVHARWPTLPIMAITADATSEVLADSTSAGIARVLTKPLGLQTLYDALAVVARQAQASIAQPAKVISLHSADVPAHLTGIFVESCEASLNRIRSALQSAEVDSVLRELHSLSGALSVFKHPSLTQQSVALQEMIKLQGLSVATDSISKFVTAVRALIDRMASRR